MTFEQQLEHLIRRVIREELAAALRSELDALGVARPKDLLTPVEAAAVSGFTAATIRDWARSGRLKRYGTTSRVRVSRTQLLEELQRGRPDPGDSVEQLADRLWKQASNGG